MLRFYKKLVLSFFVSFLFFSLAHGDDEYRVCNLLEDEVELHIFYTFSPHNTFCPNRGEVYLRVRLGEDKRFSYKNNMEISHFEIIVLSQPQKEFDVNSKKLFSLLQDEGQKRTEDKPYWLQINYKHCDPSKLQIKVDGLVVTVNKKLPKKNKRKR